MVENGYGDAKASTHTRSGCPVRHDGKQGVGMPGGKAWTANWLTFDNSRTELYKRYIGAIQMSRSEDAIDKKRNTPYNRC